MACQTLFASNRRFQAREPEVGRGFTILRNPAGTHLFSGRGLPGVFDARMRAMRLREGRVSRRGYRRRGMDAGESGRALAIRRATFHLRQGFGGQVAIERCDTSRGKPVAVFRFLSEDWSPWIALEPGMHLFAGL